MFHDGESSDFSDLILFRTIERKYRRDTYLAKLFAEKRRDGWTVGFSNGSGHTQ